MNIDNLLYLPLDIENPPLDYLDYLNNLNVNEIYDDEYRNCYHVPIMHDPNKTGELIWMPWANEMPKLQQWCEDVLFKFQKMRSRIMIITTPNGQKNPPHIDCSPGMFNTVQHKIRYVLQGNVDDLVFIGKDTTVKPKAIDKPFVMSGKWPHEMHNTSGNTKFTFASGSPWEVDPEDMDYVALLEQSRNKYPDHYLEANFDLPDDWENLFEKKYKKNAK